MTMGLPALDVMAQRRAVAADVLLKPACVVKLLESIQLIEWDQLVALLTAKKKDQDQLVVLLTAGKKIDWDQLVALLRAEKKDREQLVALLTGGKKLTGTNSSSC